MEGVTRGLVDGGGNKGTSGWRGQSRELVDRKGNLGDLWMEGANRTGELEYLAEGYKPGDIQKKNLGWPSTKRNSPPPLNCKFKTFVFLDMIGKYKIQFNYLGYDR